MPTIREFEAQVWKLEGVRVVLRASQAHAEANHNLQPYRGYLATDDACTVRRFKARLEDYTDIPFTIVGGNGLTPALSVTLGEIRETYSKKGQLDLVKLVHTQVALRKAAKAGTLAMLHKGIALKTIFVMDALLKDYATDPKSVSVATWKGMAKDLGVNFLGTKNFLEWYMLARANSPIAPPAETKKPVGKVTATGVSLLERALEPQELYVLDTLVKEYKKSADHVRRDTIMQWAERLGVGRFHKTAERFIEWYEAQLTRPVKKPATKKVK